MLPKWMCHHVRPVSLVDHILQPNTNGCFHLHLKAMNPSFSSVVYMSSSLSQLVSPPLPA